MSDPDDAAAPLTIANVASDPNGDGYVVEWSDGLRLSLPAIALRHACECEACRIPSSGQRLFDLADLGSSHHATLRHSDQHRLDFTFTDASTHDGYVSSTGLRSHGPDRPDCVRPALQLIRRGPDEIDEFASDLVETGVGLIGGLPATKGEVLRFASRIGFVRQTNYGSSFDVATLPEPDNLAYSSAGLSPHTDNPYRDPCPTVQLLHCIRPASTGGESVFVDGLAAAVVFREEDADGFAALSKTAVRFRYGDADVELSATAPIITLDTAGNPMQIRWNNRSLEAPLAVGAQLRAFYRAYLAFGERLQRPELQIRHRLEPGELVAVDNRRILHGRAGFEMEPDNEGRLLQGCYVDIDAVRSLVGVAARRR